MSNTRKKRMPVCGKGSNFKGKPGRSGAPKDNRNSMRHGLKSGQLPADAKYIENRLNTIRRNLEDAVSASKGKVTLADAAYIQTALRWERHAALAQRWLTKQYKKLTVTEQLHFSKEIARASAERDRAIEMLGLDEENSTVIDALYSRVAALPAPSNGESV